MPTLIPLAPRRPTQDLRDSFNLVTKVIVSCMRTDVAVMLHCAGSESRAAAICVAYLMKDKGATLLQVRWCL